MRFDKAFVILPVLINNAEMPNQNDLPFDIQFLARKNALRLTHERFKYDLNVLLDAVRRSIESNADIINDILSTLLRGNTASTKDFSRGLLQRIKVRNHSSQAYSYVSIIFLSCHRQHIDIMLGVGSDSRPTIQLFAVYNVLDVVFSSLFGIIIAIFVGFYFEMGRTDVPRLILAFICGVLGSSSFLPIVVLVFIVGCIIGYIREYSEDRESKFTKQERHDCGTKGSRW